MEDPVLSITLPRLAIAFLPAIVVVGILARWKLNFRTAIYGLARMLLQLILIGYVLTFIFQTESGWIVLGVLAVMATVACWISLRPLQHTNARLYRSALIAILCSAVPILFLITAFVLRLDPWFLPRYMVPLAGMVFAGAMNAVSLAAERYESEFRADRPGEEALRTSLQAALIPSINSLFAVGLVSLPGMMTGQILAGISPLVAVRYQIVIMCVLFGGSGIAAAIYLMLARKRGEASVAA